VDRLVADLPKKKELAAKKGFPLSPKTVQVFEAKIAEARTKAAA